MAATSRPSRVVSFNRSRPRAAARRATPSARVAKAADGLKHSERQSGLTIKHPNPGKRTRFGSRIYTMKSQKWTSRLSSGKQERCLKKKSNGINTAAPQEMQTLSSAQALKPKGQKNFSTAKSGKERPYTWSELIMLFVTCTFSVSTPLPSWIVPCPCYTL